MLQCRCFNLFFSSFLVLCMISFRKELKGSILIRNVRVVDNANASFTIMFIRKFVVKS